MTSTERRARPSTSAVLSPAAPPPMTTTSSRRAVEAPSSGQLPSVFGVVASVGTRAQAVKMGTSTVTSTEVDVMFQAVPRAA